VAASANGLREYIPTSRPCLRTWQKCNPHPKESSPCERPSSKQVWRCRPRPCIRARLKSATTPELILGKAASALHLTPFDQGTSGQDISNEAQESTTPIHELDAGEVGDSVSRAPPVDLHAPFGWRCWRELADLDASQPTSEGEMKSGRHSPLRSASIGEDFSLPGAASTSVGHLAGDGALAETADAGGSGSDYIGLESIPYGHFDGEFADGPSDRSQGTQPPARPIRREPDLSPTGAMIIAIKKIESIDPDHRYRMLYTNKLGTVWNTRDWDRKNIPDRPCGVSRKELELEKQRFEASEKVSITTEPQTCEWS